MKILRRRLPPGLPKSTKTLLQSNTEVNHEKKDACNDTHGAFVHLGLIEILEKTINPELHDSDVLQLSFNIDGFSPFKSGSKTVWPILCKVNTKENVYKPFTVSVYAGSAKPKSATAYLKKFVREVTEVQRHGLHVGNRHFQVNVKYFVCPPAPARSFDKCTLGHTAFSACKRYRIVGQRVDHVTVF